MSPGQMVNRLSTGIFAPIFELIKFNEMKNIIDLREVEPINVPAGSYQLWNSSFKHKTLEQVEKQTREYSEVYKYGLFCRGTGTIHLYMTCPHTSNTFNEDVGVNVCDDCNIPVNHI